MGEIILKQGENKFKIDICAANAVCAFIYHDERGCTLMNFFADIEHINNLIKNKVELFYGDIVGVKLDKKYKEHKAISKYFNKMGCEVEYYNKEG